MPKVGGKHYEYTPEGVAKAKADAKSKGVSVEYDKKYTNGGIAQGGDGGVDDIPSLLTEGEVVLNDEQQKALQEITGMPANDLFARAGVPGFKDGGGILGGAHLWGWEMMKKLMNKEGKEVEKKDKEQPPLT